MTIADIKRYVEAFKHAAKSAMEAGFDGVELHGAHGYLLDQFLQASSNNTRHDEYSGSLENRARFMLESLEAVASVVGQKRTAIRISPFSDFQGQGKEVDPYETWSYVCNEIVKRLPKLSYVSITDPRLDSFTEEGKWSKQYTSDPFRAIFRGIKSPVSKLANEATTVFPEPNEEYPTVVLAA
ncbi:hypothetical protein HDV02_000553, partial [Globomyces sp. JEL0801]